MLRCQVDYNIAVACYCENGNQVTYVTDGHARRMRRALDEVDYANVMTGTSQSSGETAADKATATSDADFQTALPPPGAFASNEG